jgi:hypothetical protein
MLLIIVGMMFFFGPGPAYLIGGGLIVFFAGSAALVGKLIFRIFGPPTAPTSSSLP